MSEQENPNQGPALSDSPTIPHSPTRAEQRSGKARSQARTAAPARKPQVAAGHQVGTAEDEMNQMVCITLHDSKEIPPNGQFVGCNGNHFIIPPGRKVWVPRYVLEVLNNAVKGEPIVDEKLTVVGQRHIPRLPYTVHFGEKYEDAQVA